MKVIIYSFGPVLGFCEHGNEPSGSIKKDCLTSWVTISFSRNIRHHGVSIIHYFTDMIDFGFSSWCGCSITTWFIFDLFISFSKVSMSL